MTESQPASQRTTLRRGKDRAHYASDEVRAVLDAGIVAHVGVNTEQGPIVLPMAYGIRDNEILVHGGVANAMLRAGTAIDVCITVTIIDGLVVAGTPLHNSMNYRSVVIRGTATKIPELEEQMKALKVINDHIAPIWDTARAPSESDYRQTTVLSVPLTEASAKIRPGDPIDDPEDISGPHWAGVVPINTTWGAPIPAQDLTPGIEVPAAVTSLDGTNAH